MRGIKHRNSDRAKSLRKESTPTERRLWRHLRDQQMNGRKWRRQQMIDQYIVDFFCPELRLVVELDGDVHAFQQKEDAIRQAYLERQGLTVVRFTNNDVNENLEGVLQVLWGMCGGS